MFQILTVMIEQDLKHHAYLVGSGIELRFLDYYGSCSNSRYFFSTSTYVVRYLIFFHSFAHHRKCTSRVSHKELQRTSIDANSDKNGGKEDIVMYFTWYYMRIISSTH